MGSSKLFTIALALAFACSTTYAQSPVKPDAKPADKPAAQTPAKPVEDKDKKPLDKNGNKKFASYLPTLLKENVIYQKDQSTTEYVFHADFIDDSCETKRSKDAEELRNTLIGLKLDDNEKWENLEFRIHLLI